MSGAASGSIKRGAAYRVVRLGVLSALGRQIVSAVARGDGSTVREIRLALGLGPGDARNLLIAVKVLAQHGGFVRVPLSHPLDTAADLVVIFATLCRAGSRRQRIEQQPQRSAPQKPSAAILDVLAGERSAARNGDVMLHARARSASFVGDP